MMKKCAISFILVLSLISSTVINATAAVNYPRASYYIDGYAAYASVGSNNKILIEFEVEATREMKKVGASLITVQVNNNGVWSGVATYYGSGSNGMLASNAHFHVGSISYTGVAGNQYRAVVTVIAGDSSGEETRSITTNAVRLR